MPSSERSLGGEDTIAGFRNADITARLYRRSPADSAEADRRYERVSRLIVKRRGHGLVAEVSRARLYRVTAHGQRVMTAAVAFHDDRYPTHYLAPADKKAELFPATRECCRGRVQRRVGGAIPGITVRSHVLVQSEERAVDGALLRHQRRAR